MSRDQEPALDRGEWLPWLSGVLEDPNECLHRLGEPFVLLIDQRQGRDAGDAAQQGVQFVRFRRLHVSGVGGGLQQRAAERDVVASPNQFEDEFIEGIGVQSPRHGSGGKLLQVVRGEPQVDHRRKFVAVFRPPLLLVPRDDGGHEALAVGGFPHHAGGATADEHIAAAELEAFAFASPGLRVVELVFAVSGEDVEAARAGGDVDQYQWAASDGVPCDAAWVGSNGRSLAGITSDGTAVPWRC